MPYFIFQNGIGLQNGKAVLWTVGGMLGFCLRKAAVSSIYRQAVWRGRERERDREREKGEGQGYVSWQSDVT